MPRPPVFGLLAMSLLAFALAPVQSAELLPQDQDISQVIDHYIGEGLAAKSIAPAALASDLVILRRTTLDLAGRIPTLAEVQAYLSSTDTDKRAKLVDRLLSSPDFAFHHANELDATLMESHAGEGEFVKYLRHAAAEDRPWNQMFQEMIAGSEDKEPEKHALVFLKKRADEIDEMTNDTSRLMFGVAVNCAQCHDHPLVSDWKQEHYFGFKAFFDRTYQTAAKQLAEKYSGEVKFKTTEGEEKTAGLMFLTGAKGDEPKRELSKEERREEEEIIKKAMKDKDAAPPKPPAFSPRAELVKLALDESNSRYFSRNIVNRLWARYFGRGMVHPLDQLHSENPASHPELMDWLTRDLVANGYRLKRLIRGIVLSDAYARDSRWTSSGDPPASELFGIAETRVLTPKQYALSLFIASTSPDKYPIDIKPEDWAKTRENLENAANGISRQMEYPGEYFQVSVSEALFFSNNDRMQSEFLRDSGDKLVGYLKTKTDPNEALRIAFQVTLNREPDAEEITAFKQYLDQRTERRAEGIQQIVWALLTSPELRFNY